MTTQANGTTASERGVRVHESEFVGPHKLALNKRPRNAGEGCGGAGDHQLNREGVQALDGDVINGENETTRATRRSSGFVEDFGGEEEELLGDAHEVPAPYRLQSHLTPRKANGMGDRRKFSILDRMNAKFSSMPTSPPPLTTRTTKVKVNHEQTCGEVEIEGCVSINDKVVNRLAGSDTAALHKV